ncbi:hypothetical protein V8B97DRAFT_2022685 [Scleroderma yunnanense]
MRSSGLEITSGENEWFPWPNRLCQLDLLTWILQINGVQDVPSYFMNSHSDIIAQEMANPHVRSKLHFYPEDSGKLLYEAHQARRCQDFYIFEPTLLSSGQVCTPTRWFQCKGLLFGKAWPLRAVVNDAGCGWIVEEHTEIEISQEDLLVSFENWSTGESTFSLPPSHNIIGVEKSHQAGLSLEPWTLTKPHKGNKWHALAKGAHVYGFPIWLYCDDTSGNLSKCWNKHNSFLFTPAGLPCATMLDGFITQLEAGQETGIWAWDCIYKEWVLVIPSVLALLGDNPMQSELGCHVGLMGKYFCHVCKVKGHDAQDITTTVEDEQPQEHSDGGRSDEQVSIRSEREGSVYAGKKSRGKTKETMKQSMNELKTMFTMASSIEALDEFIQGLPKNVYSPVWHIKGLDPHADSPVEVLHTVLLGFVKYFWRDVVNVRIGKNKTKLELVETHLSSFDTTGLGISPLSGHTLVQYAGSLMGHDFQEIA